MENIVKHILEFNSCLSITKKYMDTGVEEVHLIEDFDLPDELKKDIDSWLLSVRHLYEFEYVISNENLNRLADLQGKYLARELFWNIICTQDIGEESCENEYNLKYYYRNIFDNELVWVLNWIDDGEINTFSGRCSLLY